MHKRLFLIYIVYISICTSVGLTSGVVLSQESQPDLTPIEQLGKHLFFDTDLSRPKGQSCATCHGPEVGFTGPDNLTNILTTVYPGAVPFRFGNRKPPSAAYLGDTPILHFDEAEGIWRGGLFWDGRATGWGLGDPLAEQAQGPFLNPLEQNLPSARSVCQKLRQSTYAGLFREVWGQDAIDCSGEAVESYEKIARSIAAYERSVEVSPFSSKYDGYLSGTAELTEQERQGLQLFEGKAMCSQCHRSVPGPDGKPPLFTDFSFDNVGLPRNPRNPFYYMNSKINPDGKEWIDSGLGGFLESAGYGPEVYLSEIGKHRVPTLRNVDRRPNPGFTKAFGHNGVFKSLEQIVHFYNTRDVAGQGWQGNPWPEAEVEVNLNSEELGDLGLSPAEEAAVVAFLKTLSDGYSP